MTGASIPGVLGPAWTNNAYNVVGGRFPLGVERYIMAMVADLVPGVTTVTLNARYYSLHGYVAYLAAREHLSDSATIDLLRRAEVVLGAISSRHLQTSPQTHSGLSQPHGYNRIVTALRADDGVNLADLAAPGVYATANQGFMAAYRGSEILLGIVRDERRLKSGDQLDGPLLMRALAPLDELVAQPYLDQQTLDQHAQLCLCQMGPAEDGRWLSELFAARDSSSPSARVRRQTLQMIRIVVERTQITNFRDDLADFLCFDPAARSGPLSALPVVPHWRGLILRNLSTTAWRQLWAWLVDEIGGLSTREHLADRMADALPDTTVAAWTAELPATTDANGQLLPGEATMTDAADSVPSRALAVLALGARRSCELKGSAFDGFTARRSTDVYEELSPRWFAERLEDWKDKSLRDFGRRLTHVLINRSQRLALLKARLHPSSGVLQIPTRVLTRDHYLFTQGAEGRGQASLRLEQLARITAGMGLLDASGDTWAVGHRGGLLDA